VNAGELDAATVHGLVARAGDPKRERWLEQVRRTGACRHPVRLRGIVRRGDEVVYSTANEPDRVLMVRCGNRREACCPSCAHEYRGDMWQLVYAGLAGGRKGVPSRWPRTRRSSHADCKAPDGNRDQGFFAPLRRQP
jgi:hypothetical protein